jgi:glyoxylase-like metal-dependent hydrolase (beta-lactamase superfamily II)
MNANLVVHPIFDSDSHTVTYVVWDKSARVSAIIDSVLDYNHKNVSTKTDLADQVVAYIRDNNLRNEWILETHMHADHISASSYLAEKVGGKKAIGSNVVAVQKYLKDVFELNNNFKTDGSQFDKLFADSETFTIGTLPAKAVHSPGHTPADMVYEIGGVLFVGDTLFAPDMGTARCDFPGGSAKNMYASVRRLLESYPDDTVVYLCHDYPEGKDRAVQHTTTIGEERAQNIHVRDGISEQEFIAMRTARDKTLELPTYIFPSVQINANAGSIVPGEFIKLTYNKRVL